MDREKVIGHLNDCMEASRADNEWVFVRKDIIADTLALLKEQEKREVFIVIDKKTGKEADEYNIALHEDWAKGLCYCDMDGFAIQQDGSLILMDECGRYKYCDPERFQIKWES